MSLSAGQRGEREKRVREKQYICIIHAAIKGMEGGGGGARRTCAPSLRELITLDF